MRLKRFVSLNRVVELRKTENPMGIMYEVWILKSNGQPLNDIVYATNYKPDAEKMYKIECENKEAK